MTPAQIATVQRSFGAVLPRADAVAIAFYDRLFALDPALRRLFKPDMGDQRRKLMLTLGSVIQQLHQIEAILPSVRGLAVRHVAYGATSNHYALVGQALLGALADGVPDFGHDERSAWAAAYGALSAAMIAAAETSAQTA